MPNFIQKKFRISASADARLKEAVARVRTSKPDLPYSESAFIRTCVTEGLKKAEMLEANAKERLMKPIKNQAHFDGHGLTEKLIVNSDERDLKAGGASHLYQVEMDVHNNGYIHSVAHIQFQHGARHKEGSTPGILDSVLLAIVLDRYEGFQSGPGACEENDQVISFLRSALAAMKQRADERNNRGVLGTDQK